MNCPLGPKKCVYALKSLAKGDVPRGFEFRKVRGKGIHRDILVVGKNPGHPFKGERSHYKDKSGRDLLRSYLEFQGSRRNELIKSSKREKVFFINERRYLLYLLRFDKQLKRYKEYKINKSDDEKIFSRCLYTDLFKCSTRDERMKIKDEIFSICYKKHFAREHELIRPKVIIAVGEEVYRFLQRRFQTEKIRVPIIKMKHFSYFYPREFERKELRNLRRKLERYTRPEGS